MRNAPAPIQVSHLPLFSPSPWQMSFGERAALEGLLSQVKPALALEIGTAEGGALERIAEHAGEVHSFDLVEPAAEVQALPNVTLHTGDSHRLLPEVLAGFAEQGRNVDFALVDGDHSAEGVRADMEALLESPAVMRTVIVMHDTANEEVRRGLEAVAYATYPKVDYVELDFIAGVLFREEFENELWSGLGVVVVDAARKAYGSRPIRQSRYYETFELLRAGRDRITAAR